MSKQSNILETETTQLDPAVDNTRQIVFRKYGRLNYDVLTLEVEKRTGRKITVMMVCHVINHRRGSEWLRTALADIIGVPKEKLFLGSKLPSLGKNGTTVQ
jgi:hypothetical protein